MLVCIEYIPIPPLRIGHVLMHVFRYVFACINYWYVPIHTKYASNTCKIRINTDWYVSIHTRHVSIHALNTYKNTYQNTYQYGAVVLVRICTYQVSIRALHFPDGASWFPLATEAAVGLGNDLLWPNSQQTEEQKTRPMILKARILSERDCFIHVDKIMQQNDIRIQHGRNQPRNLECSLLILCSYTIT